MFHINLDVVLTSLPLNCALSYSDNIEVFVSEEFNLCSVYQLTLQCQKIVSADVNVVLCLISCEHENFRHKCAEIVFVLCLEHHPA